QGARQLPKKAFAPSRDWTYPWPTVENNPSSVPADSYGRRQWHVDHMLRDKPHLQFVAADDVADEQVIGAIVAAFGRASRHRPGFFQDDLVCVQQARDLHRCL